MSDYVTLTCPSCGGSLQITKDIDRFACAHCGNEHVVRRGGGIVALEPVVKKLTEIKTGVDKTASELAIKRLEGEIDGLEGEIDGLEHEIEGEKYKLNIINTGYKDSRTVSGCVGTIIAFGSLGLIVVTYFAWTAIAPLIRSAPKNSDVGLSYLTGAGIVIAVISVMGVLFGASISMKASGTPKKSKTQQQKEEKIETSIAVLKTNIAALKTKLRQKQAELKKHDEIVSKNV